MARVKRKTSAYSKESAGLTRKLALVAKQPMPKWRTALSLDKIALWCKANHMSYGQWQQKAYFDYFGGIKNGKNRGTIHSKEPDMGGAQ